MTLTFEAKKGGIEYFQEWRGREGHFAKIFLMNDLRNRNGWKVTWDSIESYHQTFVGFPGIKFHTCDTEGCHLDHTTNLTYDSSLVSQEPYRVSTVVETELKESIHTAYAIHEVKADFFEEMKEDPNLYVSPAMWPLNGYTEDVGVMLDGRKMVDISRWVPVHVAFVHEPAYGQEARIVSKCSGKGENCEIQMNASVQRGTPLLIEHHGEQVYYTPPEDVNQRIQAAKSEDEVRGIVDEILKKGRDAQDGNVSATMEEMKECEYNAAVEKLDNLEARLRLANIENRLLSAASPGEEKSTDKPDVDERGSKCHWVTSRGRKFQVCEDVKSHPVEKPSPSERKEEKK